MTPRSVLNSWFGRFMAAWFVPWAEMANSDLMHEIFGADAALDERPPATWVDVICFGIGRKPKPKPVNWSCPSV